MTQEFDEDIKCRLNDLYDKVGEVLEAIKSQTITREHQENTRIIKQLRDRLEAIAIELDPSCQRLAVPAYFTLDKGSCSYRVQSNE